MFSILIYFCLLATFTQGCDEEFESFKIVHQKNYATAHEHTSRKKQFCSNLLEIERLNQRANRTWTAGVNAYSDLSWKEFKIAVGLLNDPQNCSATTRGSFVSKKHKKIPKVIHFFYVFKTFWFLE